MEIDYDFDFVGSTLSLATTTTSVGSASTLPWGAPREYRDTFSTLAIPIDTNVKPGEYVLQSLFAEYTIQAERKIEKIMAEPLESPLQRSLQRGEDPQFDQLLSSLGSVAEHCLPSLLKCLFEWYDIQNGEIAQEERQKTSVKTTTAAAGKGEKDYLYERRDLSVDFLFCLVLIEVLKKLSRHPVSDPLITHIENIAMKHFRHRDGYMGPNAGNIHIIADLYAEVIGVLAQTRYQSIEKKFIHQLKEIRSEPQNVNTTQSIISLIMGMKFYRVVMFPVEDFEASFQMLNHCAQYFLEVKDKDIKHALAGLLVEILVPVAAAVKNEVNIPVLKNFVEKLYPTTYEQCQKKKHALAFFPLITCLLCVSQKHFFLSNWHNFLNMCLSHLKHRDAKMSRVALESLYRLLWVYMIRIKCESNTTTQSRLQSIVNSLFPKGSRNVVPRDTPLNIFVKIIQFIAQEKLDFALKDVVFDLLGVNSKTKFLFPERMNIGLRAFLVIADSLQQKDGEPPMPSTTSVLPSGNTLRVKKTFLNKQLTEDAAKTIGIAQYHLNVKRALDSILRSVDMQVGRVMMMTNSQCVNKEPEDLMTNERKPKIDLFRTCVAAIPRLIPDGMCRQDLLDLLCRLTVHMDEELRGLAFTALQNVILDLPEWREEVLHCFVNFILKEVQDTFAVLLDSALRMLVQLLTQWRSAVQGKDEKERFRMNYERSPHSNIINYVEGFALVILCSCRPVTRKLSVLILKECRALYAALGYSKVDDDPVIDVIDKACPSVVENLLSYLPPSEKAVFVSTPVIDLQWVIERSLTVWSGNDYGNTLNDSYGKPVNSINSAVNFDVWSSCLAGFLNNGHLPHYSPAAVSHAWPSVFVRLTQLQSHIDQNNPAESTTRPSLRTKKVLNTDDANIALWKNYLVFACSCTPSSSGIPIRPVSPDILNASTESMPSEKAESKTSVNVTSDNAGSLFKMIVPLLRSDNPEVRDAVVSGLGWTNPHAFKDLVDEMTPFIREAIERKQENVRRKKKREALRVQLVHVFDLLAEHGILRESYCGMIDKETGCLSGIFVDFVEGTRLVLDSEGDKDSPTLNDIRLHFSGFIRKLIRSVPVENRKNLLKQDLRYSLFFLCVNWCRRFGVMYNTFDKNSSYQEKSSDLEISALQAMAALLVCGPVFDNNAISPEGYLYNWLDGLLNFPDNGVHQLGKETVVLLLQNNPEVSTVLSWAIDRCYTGSKQIADGCFQAFATVLNKKDYPCELIPMLCVTLFKTADPCKEIKDTALRLLQVLDQRFFGMEDGVGTPLSQSSRTALTLSPTYGKVHTVLSEELAKLHPELTIAVFSEMTERFESAPQHVRQEILECLLPWLSNIELVDHNTSHRDLPKRTATKEDKEMCNAEFEKCPLRGEGWGSQEATNIVLNNLFYITVEYGDEHPRELEQLWAALCVCWSYNLKVILNYLMMMAGIPTNPDILPFVKRVLTYIGRAKPKKLVEEMMHELMSAEIVNSTVEKLDEAPYFRLYVSKKDEDQDPVSPTESSSVSSVQEKYEREFRDDSCSDVSKMMAHDGSDFQSTSSIHDRQVERSQVERSRVVQDDSKAILKMGMPIRADSVSSHSSLTSPGSVMMDQSTSTASLTVSANSAEDPSPHQDLHSRTSSFDRGEMDTEDDSHGDEPRDAYNQWRYVLESQGSSPQPQPLPMPENGGYYAPLADYIADNGNIHTSPSAVMYRCHLALILMTELVSEGMDVDWSTALPQLLHVLFLGLDHARPLVHEHCKKLLVNLLVVLSAHGDHPYVAKLLLANKTVSDLCLLTEPSVPKKTYNFTGDQVTGDIINTHDMQDPNLIGSTTTLSGVSTSSSISSNATVVPNSPVRTVHIDVGTLTSLKESAKALIEFLVTRKCQPLWCYEDITSKVVAIKSAEQLEAFLKHVVRIFRDSLPGKQVDQRWAQVALHLAKCCSSRHYAGRSFQIFRSLGIPLTPRWLSDILSRLVETVADQGEDTQGYVTEIMLTLEYAVDLLAPEIVTGEMKDIFRPLPEFSTSKTAFRKSTGNIMSLAASGMYLGPKRSNSVSVTRLSVPSPSSADKHTEHCLHPRTRALTTGEIDAKKPMARSRSAQSLKHLGEQNLIDDRLGLLAQVFWIAVSMLESDYEYEFLLAMRLVDKLLTHLTLGRTESREKIEKVFNELKWDEYPGLQALLLKGFTSPTTSEPTLQLVGKLTLFTSLSVVDPTGVAGFPMNIIALLPNLAAHFENPDDFCKECAENIAQICLEKYPNKLDSLATVMDMYSKKTYSKDRQSWTYAVCKYVHDAFQQLSIAMLTFLVEVLEKGPIAHQQPVLQIIKDIISNIDLMAAPMQQVNGDLLRVITKYVQGTHWQKALEILQLAVKGSSKIVTPPTNSETEICSSAFLFGDMDSTRKKDLPGRTLEFTFDLSRAAIEELKRTPLLTHKFPSIMTMSTTLSDESATSSSDTESMITLATDIPSSSILSMPSQAAATMCCTVNQNVVSSCWRKPQLSQRRTREHLVSVLNGLGQDVGLPRSPSVIFSSASDIAIERHPSICSSNESISMVEGLSAEGKLDNSGGGDQFGVLKDFDFLDTELEEKNEEGFNWAVTRQSLESLDRHDRGSRNLKDLKDLSGSAPSLEVGDFKDESSDDEMRSISPVDETLHGPNAEIQTAVGGIYGSSPKDTHFFPLGMHPLDSRASPVPSTSSACSDTDVTDTSLLSSSNITSTNTSFINIATDEVEEVWRYHVNSVMSDSNASCAVNTFHIFAKLYAVTRRRFCNLTRESCTYLSDRLRGIATQFLNMLELLLTQAECPHVYTDTETMLACKLLERHKFVVLEIQEHYETYINKRDTTVECLDNLKSSLKMQTLASPDEIFVQTELCRCLYKLHFQLLMLFESYSKLINLLNTASKNQQITDHSKEVTIVRQDLKQAMNEIDSSKTPLIVSDDDMPQTTEKARQLLSESIINKQYTTAVRFIRHFRSVWPHDMFGGSDEDDLNVLLNIYCKNLADNKTGVLVITRPEHDLSDVCRRLMNVNIQLQASLRMLENITLETKELESSNTSQ
ncbi:protein furry homolog-like [Glandiceps talaboti]